MAKRRASGEGMLRKKDDGRWEGRIVVGHKENGLLGNRIKFLICGNCGAILYQCVAEPHRFPQAR